VIPELLCVLNAASVRELAPQVEVLAVDHNSPGWRVLGLAARPAGRDEWSVAARSRVVLTGRHSSAVRWTVDLDPIAWVILADEDGACDRVR
jgi:hypothetical protein